MAADGGAVSELGRASLGRPSMTRPDIAANSQHIDALLAILADCASRNVQRPPTGDISIALGISNCMVNAAQRRLVERGDIVVEGNGVSSCIYVRSAGAWTAQMTRKKGRRDSAAPRAGKVRRCLLTDCRSEFTTSYAGEWYCPQCRRKGLIP